MNTKDLMDSISQYKFLSKITAGVFSRDKIPDIYQHPCCFIANTDTSDKPGQHWVAIFVNEKNVAEFFDSYGMEPDKNFKKYLRRENFDSYIYIIGREFNENYPQRADNFVFVIFIFELWV